MQFLRSCLVHWRWRFGSPRSGWPPTAGPMSRLPIDLIALSLAIGLLILELVASGRSASHSPLPEQRTRVRTQVPLQQEAPENAKSSRARVSGEWKRYDLFHRVEIP